MVKSVFWGTYLHVLNIPDKCRKCPKIGTFSVFYWVFWRSNRCTPTLKAARSNRVGHATSPQASLGLRRLFCFTDKPPRRLVPLRLLSAKGHARFACSLVNALTTALCRYQPFAGVPTAGCFFFAFLNAILNVVHIRGGTPRARRRLLCLSIRAAPYRVGHATRNRLRR